MSVENLLKTKIDIVEYIGRFTELRPKGSLYEADVLFMEVMKEHL